MELHAKLVRSQLSFSSPLWRPVPGGHPEGPGQAGRADDRPAPAGGAGAGPRFRAFFGGAWVMPKDQRRTGVILYLHGGGYTCGSLEYAKGFAAALASECGVRVFCPAYRLAPRHPYPAALDDALESYQYLLKKGL